MFNKISWLYRRVKHVLCWVPIIWNDHDFDQGYLTTMLRFKLEKMEKFFKSEDAWSLHADQYGESIKRVRLLLDRIEKDEYYENAFRYHEKKWGELEMWTTPTDRKDLVECNLNRKKVCNTDDYEQERKESSRLYKHAEYLKKQDIDEAFRLMAKYYQTWWD